MHRLAIGPLAAVLACAHLAPDESRQREAAGAQWWVDASAAPGGDGSAERPWRSLADALTASPGPARIQLATGMYEGPFEIAEGVRLVGGRAVVLHSEAAGAVVRVQGRAELESLLVQGGDVGIEAGADLRLNGVGLSGHRQAGLVQRSGVLEGSRLEITGTISGTTGVRLESGSRARIADSSFSGALRIAVEVESRADLELARVRFDGVDSAVRSRGGTVRATDVSGAGGRGPAFVFAGGEARLRDVRVQGHEYAVMAASDCRLFASGVTSVRAERAGISITSGARAELEEVVIVESGAYGGIHSVNGELDLRRFFIGRANAYGINLHNGTAEIRDGVISGVADPGGAAGEGIHIRVARARVASVAVQKTAGPGILAAQGARVALRDVLLEENGWAGVLVETLAHLEGTSVVVRRSRGNALAVPGDATARVDLLSVADGAEAPVFVDCGAGAKLYLSRAQGVPPLAAPCAQTWASPVLFDPFADAD